MWRARLGVRRNRIYLPHDASLPPQTFASPYAIGRNTFASGSLGTRVSREQLLVWAPGDDDTLECKNTGEFRIYIERAGRPDEFVPLYPSDTVALSDGDVVWLAVEHSNHHKYVSRPLEFSRVRSTPCLASLDNTDQRQLQEALASLHRLAPLDLKDGSLEHMLSRTPAECAAALVKVRAQLRSHGRDNGPLLIDGVHRERESLLFAAGVLRDRSEPPQQQQPRQQSAAEKRRLQMNEALRRDQAEMVQRRARFFHENRARIEPFCEPKVLASLAKAAAAAPPMPPKRPLDEQPDSVVGGEMRDYQLVGLDWMADSCERHGLSPILGDEMGLGKTLQTISVIAHMARARKLPGAALVVCPLSVLSTWCAELKRWAPSLRAIKLHSSDTTERERLRSRLIEEVGEYDVVVTTYEMVKSPALQGVLVQKVHWRLVVLDEGHVLKNSETEISKTVRKMHFVHALLLTGTPLQNNLTELWALLNLLYPEVFTTKDGFDEAFNIGQGRLEGDTLRHAHQLLQLLVAPAPAPSPAELGLGSSKLASPAAPPAAMESSSAPIKPSPNTGAQSTSSVATATVASIDAAAAAAIAATLPPSMDRGKKRARLRDGAKASSLDLADLDDHPKKRRRPCEPPSSPHHTTALVQKSQPHLEKLMDENDAQFAQSGNHVLRGLAWDMKTVQDSLRSLLSRSATNTSDSMTVITHLLQPKVGNSSREQLRGAAKLLLAHTHIGESPCATTLKDALAEFEKDPSSLFLLRREIIAALEALVRRLVETEDYAQLAQMVSRRFITTSKNMVAAGQASSNEAGHKAQRNKQQQRFCHGGYLEGGSRFGTAQAVHRTANGQGPLAAVARLEHNALEEAAADEGGYVEHEAPGNCRSLQATLELRRIAQSLQPAPSTSFDPNQMCVMLKYPLHSIKSAILPDIARVQVGFLGKDGVVVRPSLVAEGSQRLAELMLSGDAPAATLNGANQIKWLDLTSPSHVGTMDKGASKRTLALIELFDCLAPFLARLSQASIEDNAVWIRLSAQPAATALAPMPPPKVHMDQAAPGVNGLGQVLVRFAISGCGRRSFDLSADGHREFVTNLLRDTPGDAVAMKPCAYTWPEARVFHAAGEAGIGDGVGLTIIVTLRCRKGETIEQGYTGLMERLRALGLIVTPL